jgi:hypothetical protein
MIWTLPKPLTKANKTPLQDSTLCTQNFLTNHFFSLSTSTPEEGEHFVVDGSGSASNSQQQLFGLVDTYQEMLRSSNIGAIEDVEFERAILSNCMPGGLLGENFWLISGVHAISYLYKLFFMLEFWIDF